MWTGRIARLSRTIDSECFVPVFGVYNYAKGGSMSLIQIVGSSINRFGIATACYRPQVDLLPHRLVNQIAQRVRDGDVFILTLPIYPILHFIAKPTRKFSYSPIEAG